VTTHQVACLLVWVTFTAIVDKGLAGPFEVFMVAIVATLALRKQAGDRPDARRAAAETRRSVATAEGGGRP
jgi:hypothetical protein